MEEEIFELIKCPENLESCLGLFVLTRSGSIEKEQNPNGYIVRTEDEDEDMCERFGNCPHYEKCYINAIRQTLKKSASAITPGFAMEAYN